MSLTISPTSGIYKITCTANGKIYVGSSHNIRRRCNKHRSNLCHNRHPNKHLQRAWNTHGEEYFTFEVLEFVMPWMLLDREQYWLDTLQPFGAKGFNGNRLAGQSPTLGVGHTPETKAKLREAGKKGRGRKQTPEHIENNRRANIGRVLSLETRAKISMAHKGKSTGKRDPEVIKRAAISRQRHWVVTNPDGEEFEILGLAAFCRENGLSSATMNGVASGREKMHKGWRCRRIKND